MQAASLPRPGYNAFAHQLEWPCGLWTHGGRGRLLPLKAVHAEQRSQEAPVSPSPGAPLCKNEAGANAAASVVAHPAAAGRGEGTQWECWRYLVRPYALRGRVVRYRDRDAARARCVFLNVRDGGGWCVWPAGA